MSGDLLARRRALIDSYGGDNFLNLAASLEQRLCGDSPLPPCRALAGFDVRAPAHLVVLLVDGLGDALLQRHGAADGPLRQQQIARLHSVFPSTTSAAISTLLTARAPAEHGVLAWHCYPGGERRIYTTLLARDRHLDDRGRAPPRGLYCAEPLFARARQRVEVVQPRYLIDSPFTRRHLGPHTRISAADSLKQLFGQLRHLIALRGPSLVYAYWPALDTLGHRHGAGSAPWRAALAELEQALETFQAAARGADYLLLATADHGMIDAEGGALAPLEARLPALAPLLANAIAGEPRTLFCQLAAGRGAEFDALCASSYGALLHNSPSADLFEQGLFGPRADGAAHAPAIIRRAGDRVLQLRARLALSQRLAHEEATAMIGVHGGLHAEEIAVPLIAMAGGP